MNATVEHVTSYIPFVKYRCFPLEQPISVSENQDTSKAFTVNVKGKCAEKTSKSREVGRQPC